LIVASVTLKGVSKVFGKTLAVNNVSLEVPDKKFVVLVGPSGCGKTTVLRMTAGLEELTGGELRIGSRLVNDIEPKDRNVAMVFQNYALYPHMNVYKNLAIGLQLRKVSKDQIDLRVRDAAQMLGLAELLDRKPAALSGGERQRVAMGRAIVRKPDVFLFDEPLSNLDAKLRIKMRAEIKQLHSRLETTVLYVTHDQVEAMTLADEIVVMNQGAIMQQGPPLEVFRAPKNLFVAGFLGAPSMNFARVRLTKLDGKYNLGSPGLDLDLPVERRAAADAWIDRDVILGARPEHIQETASNPEVNQNVIEGEVRFYEPLGSETLVHLTVGAQEILAIFRGDSYPRVGSRMRFYIDMSKSHLFDPATEAAIF
jgi:multiple sugar transport system ATP-binding protein